MTQVIVTHAPAEQARAAKVAEKLSALGFKVRQDADIFRALSPFERRKLAADIDNAACVLVLWSREAADAPALHAAAARAKAAGKLAYARLDVAALPARVGGVNAPNLVNWQGRDQDRGWRQLVAAVGAKAQRAAAPVLRAVSAPAAAVRAPAAAVSSPVRAASAPARAVSAPVRPVSAPARAPEPEAPAKKKGGGGLLVAAVLVLLAAAAAGYYFFVYEGPPLF